MKRVYVRLLPLSMIAVAHLLFWFNITNEYESAIILIYGILATVLVNLVILRKKSAPVTQITS